MKCNDCGSTGFTSSSCPDCGSDNVAEVLGGTPSAPSAAAAPAAAPDPNATPESDPTTVMPVVDMTAATGPVVGIIKMPDGSSVELRDGETFSVAHETSDQDPTFRIAGDETISGKLISVAASSGKGTVTGGGGAGFALDFTFRFKPDVVVELPKTVDALIALLQSGQASFTATALKVGKSDRFPLKF